MTAPEIRARLAAGVPADEVHPLLDELKRVEGADAIPAQPDAAFLSRVLREGPEWRFWPEGFEWDYGTCTNCAVGLADKLWVTLRLSQDLNEDIPHLAKIMGITERQADMAFVGAGHQPGRASKPLLDVTPADVADALDRALATRSAP